MKRLFVLLTALFALTQMNAQEKKNIRISTDNTDLILQVAPNGRLYQTYLGDKLLNEQDINHFSYAVKGGSDGSVSTAAGKFIRAPEPKTTLNLLWPSPTMTVIRVPSSAMYLPSRKRWQTGRKLSSI